MITLKYRWSDDADCQEVETFGSSSEAAKRLMELQQLQNPRDGHTLLDVETIPEAPANG